MSGVGTLKRSDVPGTGFPGIGQLDAPSPRKWWATERLHEQVSDEAGMSPVAVGEEVDCHQPMVEPHRNLVIAPPALSAVAEPCPAISEELLNCRRDHPPVDSDVLVSPAVSTRPLPHTTEDVAVKLVQEFRVADRFWSKAPAKCPTRSLGDPGGLSSVEVSASSYPTEEEAVGLILVKRSRVRRDELIAHWYAQRSREFVSVRASRAV